jgi:mRNA interferase RelE/StbE
LPAVELSRRAVRDLDRLSKRAATRVADSLERLANDPRVSSLDVKALVGRRPWLRLRVGEHRVLFRISNDGQVLLVARVVDRRDLDLAVASLPD